MSDLAIRVENLSKRYRIGGKQERYKTLRDTIGDVATAPFRRAAAVLQGRATQSSEEEIWALKDVSFEVKRGEVVGIIGRNGAGKSTLLKVLSRITEPTEGRAMLKGRIAALLEVGTGFNPELTGRENIYLNAAILGMKKVEIDRKFDEIVAFAGVEKFLDTPVKHYSSGMHLRLGFAVAAHLEPEILVVDEVLAVGDAEFQKKCLGKMGDVAKSGRTVLFVSHQMNSIRRLCSRCLWLDAGGVHGDGPPVKVVSDYEACFREKPGAERAGAAGPNALARFLRWEVASPREADPCSLGSIGPVSICFMVELRRPLRDGVHGIALRSAEGAIMWAWAAYHLNLEPGRYGFTYNLPTLPLRPGNYDWLVSLYNDGELVDYWAATPPLLVSTEPMTHPRDEWSGVLNVPCAFEPRRAGGGSIEQ